MLAILVVAFKDLAQGSLAYGVMKKQVDCGGGLILEPRAGGCLARSEAELFHGCVTGTFYPLNQITMFSHLPPQLFLAKSLLAATGINLLERLNSWRGLAMKVMREGEK